MSAERSICGGCGAPVDRKHEALVAVGTSHVIVCGIKRHYTVDPKTACMRKVREKLSICPGCDASDTPPGTICDTCRQTLDRAADIPAEQAATWYALDPSLLGHITSINLVGYFDDPKDKHERKGVAVLRCLGRLAAAKGPRRFLEQGYAPETEAVRWQSRAIRLVGKDREGTYGANEPSTEDPKVELDDDQLAALQELGGILARWVRAHYLRGVEEGRRVLSATADGTLAFRNLDDPSVRLAKKRQEWGIEEEASEEASDDDEDNDE